METITKRVTGVHAVIKLNFGNHLEGVSIIEKLLIWRKTQYRLKGILIERSNVKSTSLVIKGFSVMHMNMVRIF